MHEQFLTDTARFADILLPATTIFEQTELLKAYGHLYVALNRPAIPPLGEALPANVLALIGSEQSPKWRGLLLWLNAIAMGIALAEYVHAHGLRFGLYTCAGALTRCTACPNPGETLTYATSGLDGAGPTLGACPPPKESP